MRSTAAEHGGAMTDGGEARKMLSSYSYWAGPWKPTGPRPHSACSDRAKGRAAAWLGASAHGHLA